MSSSLDDPLNRGTLITFGGIMGGMTVLVLLRLACIKYSEWKQERIIRVYRLERARRLTEVFVADNPLNG